MNRLVYRWTTPQLSSGGRKLLDSIIESGQWSYGPVARHVEREIATDLGVSNVLLTNSGTSALWILLAMARQKDKQQVVILPAFGYSAAANVAATLGYDLYIADSTEGAPVVDPKSVERLLDDKVEFVIGINYFGYSVDWDRMPKDKKFTVIEDAAGSFGAQYKDRPSASNADLSIISFHTSKAAAAGGEGGCIIARDERIIQKAKAIGRSGHVKGYYYAEMPGMNMLMTDVAACFLGDTIKHFQAMNGQRREIVNTIDATLKNAGLEVVGFNHSSNERTQNYQTYAMFVDNRDLVVELMRMGGFEVRPCWPFLIPELPATKNAVKKVDGSLINAKRFAQRIINIPVNPLSVEGQFEKLAVALPKILKVRK